MNRKELIERELDDLPSLVTEFTNEVQSTVSKIRGTECVLWLKEPDRHRLLILKTWTERYNVDLKYILEKLLPMWEGFISKHSKRIKGKGLNVRVSTLTGKKSEIFLQDLIKKDFPNDINKVVRESEERERLVRRAHRIINRKKQINDKKYGIIVSDKRRTKFGSLSRYVRHYRYFSGKEAKFRMKLEEQFQERPYRTNPFLGR